MNPKARKALILALCIIVCVTAAVWIVLYFADIEKYRMNPEYQVLVLGVPGIIIGVLCGVLFTFGRKKEKVCNFCTNCGSPADKKRNVCLNCGCRFDTGMEFCANCGSSLKPHAVICTSCGTPCGTAKSDSTEKDWLTTLLLCIFVGNLGIHRFYVGKTGTGILWLLTFGIFGIGTLIDIIMLFCDTFSDAHGAVIKQKKSKT